VTTSAETTDELVKRIYERELSLEEFDALVKASLADEEDFAAQVQLIDWFKRRYPTARERLAYARRKYAEWTRPPTRIP
jgi:hypothetical protein